MISWSGTFWGPGTVALKKFPTDLLLACGHLGQRGEIGKSPNTTATSNPDGTVTQRTVNHYRRLGEGGPGLVMVEYTYVDDDASKSIHGQTGISRQDHVAAAVRRVADRPPEHRVHGFLQP